MGLDGLEMRCENDWLRIWCVQSRKKNGQLKKSWKEPWKQPGSAICRSCRRADSRIISRGVPTVLLFGSV